MNAVTTGPTRPPVMTEILPEQMKAVTTGPSGTQNR
jgi:hypothetical protein